MEMGRPIRSTCVSCDFQQSGCALHGPPTSGSQSLDTRVMPVSAACDPEVAGGNAAIESPWPEPSRTIWPPGPGRNSPWGLSASGVRVSRGLPRSKAASGHWPTSRWRAPCAIGSPCSDGPGRTWHFAGRRAAGVPTRSTNTAGRGLASAVDSGASATGRAIV